MKLSKEFIAMFREEAKKAQWEINCWNGKSIDDLVVDYLERKELKPEDFTGAVVLKVDEAKTIKDLIWKLQCSQPNAMNADDWFTYWAMNGRIEQAEGK